MSEQKEPTIAAQQPEPIKDVPVEQPDVNALITQALAEPTKRIKELEALLAKSAVKEPRETVVKQAQAKAAQDKDSEQEQIMKRTEKMEQLIVEAGLTPLPRFKGKPAANPWEVPADMSREEDAKFSALQTVIAEGNPQLAEQLIAEAVPMPYKLLALKHNPFDVDGVKEGEELTPDELQEQLDLQQLLKDLQPATAQRLAKEADERIEARSEAAIWDPAESALEDWLSEQQAQHALNLKARKGEKLTREQRNFDPDELTVSSEVTRAYEKAGVTLRPTYEDGGDGQFTYKQLTDSIKQHQVEREAAKVAKQEADLAEELLKYDF